jgi:hypothetical protein
MKSKLVDSLILDIKENLLKLNEARLENPEAYDMFKPFVDALDELETRLRDILGYQLSAVYFENARKDLGLFRPPTISKNL